MRLKFFGELKKHGVVAKFEPLRERQAAGWLAAEARRLKIDLRPGAAEGIADAVGTDMAQLASALERVSLFVGLDQAAGPSDVDELLRQTRQRSIFELTNAVGRGRRREALLVLRRMVQDREPGVRIVAMLARHLRQLWSARELVGRGQSKGDIAAALGIHPYFVGDVLEQARKWSIPALGRTHRALFEADRRLKSSRLSDGIILEQLVLDLCPAEGRGAERG
jgi:DNA polymerase-3 subunit delta